MAADAWHLDWPHGALEVQPPGGMIGPLRFKLKSGRHLSIFAVAPWSDETIPVDAPAIPGHLKRLRGAFPCLPFGMASEPGALAPAWRGMPFTEQADPPHGFCANESWRMVATSDVPLSLRYDYPVDHAIASIRQEIRPDPARPVVDIAIEVIARRAVRLPFGQHFILRLDENIELEAPEFEFGLTYPAIVEPDLMLTAPGCEFGVLSAAPARDGGTIDLTRFPLGKPFEDVVQLCGMRGPVTAIDRAARATVRIEWDRTVLPSCLLWMSNKGLGDYPWQRRFTGLGIEPLAAAFDFSTPVSNAANPIAKRGIATTIEFTPERAWKTRFRVEAVEGG
ncbi:hypothetical protein [Hypericibacter sp.]|uniref:hypothetical protein n=1 Tax=Hypericibacter sp. TaxID=2705401 RepID=UPI003D6D3EF6